MELVLSISFGAWFVISGVCYWFMTRNKGGKAK